MVNLCLFCWKKEVVVWVWGKWNIKTAQKLLNRLKDLGVNYDEICTDNREAFSFVFHEDTHKIVKKYTTNIEGNNTLLRHHIRRAVRKTCCFSKKLEKHIKAFEIVFFTSILDLFECHTLYITTPKKYFCIMSEPIENNWLLPIQKKVVSLRLTNNQILFDYHQ